MMSEASDANVSVIILSRGDAGLGFNIRGGIDNPHLPGDVGIFVTKIRENGAAFMDGRLKEGDKILEINGKNLERVTHNEAVECFVNAGNEVILKVRHGAQNEIASRMDGITSANTRSAQDSGSSFPVTLTIFGVVTAVAIIGGYIYFRKAR